MAIRSGESGSSTAAAPSTSSCPISNLNLPPINPEKIEQALEDMELPTFKEK